MRLGRSTGMGKGHETEADRNQGKERKLLNSLDQTEDAYVEEAAYTGQEEARLTEHRSVAATGQSSGGRKQEENDQTGNTLSGKKVSKSVKKPLYRRASFRVAVAAALVLAILTGYLLGQGRMRAYAAYAIAEAQYPKMAQYPGRKAWAYDSWWEDRRAQMDQPEGYRDGTDAFYRKSIQEFLLGAEGENVVYSPLNLYLALGMMAEITDGNSREQILEVLGVEDIETLRMKASALWNANYCDDGAVTSILASSLWLNQDVDFRQETLQRLAETYYASSFAGEMGSKKYTQALQEWVNVQTGELLKDAAFDTQMDSETVMKLIATIYYRAKWSDEFSKGNTENGTFYAADGTETCSFMHQTMDQTYYWGEKFSAVNKSLRESGRMWFLLPDEGVSVDELIQDEETMNFLFSMDNWENSKYLEVRLQVPKFDISSQFDLTGDLQRMGITEVFDSAVADYSPLTTDVEEIALSSATHTARVMIDEEGCIAAAYTQMQYSGSAAPPDETVDFILDRPFLFMITGSDGTPLFIGVVNHP